MCNSISEMHCDVILLFLALESTCGNNAATNISSKITPHNRPTSDVVSSFNPNAMNFKDEDKRRSFTPKQVNYEKYHLPSYKEQYLMGRKIG